MTDRESHRAAVEAGYASLAEYIEKWEPTMVEATQKRYADDVTLQELVRLRVEIERLRETIANAAKLNARLMDIIHLAKRMKTAAFNHWCEKTPETNGILVDLQFEFEDALEGLKRDGYFSFRPSTKGE